MRISVVLRVLCEDNAERPRLAEILISRACVDHFKELVCQAKRLKLVEVREDRSPDAWHGMANVCTIINRLCVTDTGTGALHFECREKRSGVVFETQRVYLADIEEALDDVERTGDRWFAPDEMTHDEAIDTIPCTQVEYDLAYWGGDYADVGSFAVIPNWLIGARSGSVAEAFTYLTGHNAAHIVRFESDAQFSLDGVEREEVTS